MKPDVSIVIPVFNAQNHIEQTVEAFTNQFNNAEIILVDDDSTDNTWKVITGLKEKFRTVAAIRLKENVGQHRAIFFGFYYTKGDYVITTDDDLSVEPVDFKDALNYLKSDSKDIVILTYDKRNTPVFNRMFNYLYRKTFKVEKDGTNHKVFLKELLPGVLPYYSKYLFIDTLLLRAASAIGFYEITRAGKISTPSRYNFKSKVKFALSNILHYILLLNAKEGKAGTMKIEEILNRLRAE